MDEQALMKQVQQGNEMAFTKLVNIYKDRIVNYLYQTLGDYQRALDLSQETFLRVYFKAHQYKPRAPFSSWIYTIASNLAKTEMKKRRRLPLVSIEDVPNKLIRENPLGNPNNNILVLKKVLNSLPAKYRIPIILKEIEGFSLIELAQILKTRLGTIKARLSRGKKMLKEKLEGGKRWMS
jgi:RNA polymerase sigma-70 factor (ECF subfamily)